MKSLTMVLILSFLISGFITTNHSYLQDHFPSTSNKSTLSIGSTPYSKDQTLKAVSGLLTGVQVLSENHFDEANALNEWKASPEVRLNLNQQILEMKGRYNWDSYLEPDQRYHELYRSGNAIIIRYKFTPGSEFELYFGCGEWQTDSFKQFGIYETEADPRLNIWQGKNQCCGNYDSMDGNLVSSPEQWKLLLIAIGYKGDFLTAVWNPNDLNQMKTSYRKLGKDWAGQEWLFRVQANKGEILVDDFVELSFDAIKLAEPEMTSTILPSRISTNVKELATQTARLPTKTSTKVKAQTTRTTRMPTITPTPDPALDPLLVINETLENPTIRKVDLPIYIKGWTYWQEDNKPIIEGEVVKLQGDNKLGNYQAFVNPVPFYEGQGLLMKLKFNNPTSNDVSIGFDRGGWNTDKYKAFYLWTDANRLMAGAWDGTKSTHWKRLSLTPKQDYLYYVMFVIDNGGIFMIKVWDAHNPKVTTQDINNRFVQGWNDLDWTMCFRMEGRKAVYYVYEYYKIDFSGIKKK